MCPPPLQGLKPVQGPNQAQYITVSAQDSALQSLVDIMPETEWL